MKNLSLISFVGIDAMTEFDNLLQFKDSNIIYEFGILYSNSSNSCKLLSFVMIKS